MLASVLLQTAPDWLDQVIMLLAVLLGLPIVNSLFTSLLRRFTDATGLDPRVLVYAVSVVVTALVVWQKPGDLPGFDSSNPAAFVTAWLALATTWAELAKVIYDKLLRELPVFRG